MWEDLFTFVIFKFIFLGSKFGEKKLAVKQTLSNEFSLHEMKNAKSKLENIIYLEDSSLELFGIRIYGTPWLIFHFSQLIK